MGMRALASAVLAWQQGGAAGGGFAGMLIIILPMLAIFYFLLILPQQRRQKKWQAMLGSLKTGDRVITSGGLRGTIIALRDEFLHLRVPPDNLRIEVARSSVVSVSTGDETLKAQ